MMMATTPERDSAAASTISTSPVRMPRWARASPSTRTGCGCGWVGAGRARRTGRSAASGVRRRGTRRRWSRRWDSPMARQASRDGAAGSSPRLRRLSAVRSLVDETAHPAELECATRSSIPPAGCNRAGGPHCWRGSASNQHLRRAQTQRL